MRYKYERSIGHHSSTECLQETTLLNVISHSSTPQAGAPSFFSKTTSVDFIGGELPLFSTSRLPSQVLAPCSSWRPAVSIQFPCHFVTSSKPPCPVPGIELQAQVTYQCVLILLQSHLLLSANVFQYAAHVFDGRPWNAHNRSEQSSRENMRFFLYIKYETNFPMSQLCCPAMLEVPF